MRLKQIPLILACILFLAGAWYSSGTMSPYSLQDTNASLDSCGRLVTVDHWHFKAPYQMLLGEPKDVYKNSVVLRRLLYPVITLPFYLTLGFEDGGFIFNILLHLAMFVLVWKYLLARYSLTASSIGILLLSLYPGIHYWIYMPYSYALIVPLGCACYWILEKLLELAPNDSTTEHRLIRYSLYFGILLTGYDFMNYFYLPFIWIIFKILKPSKSLKKKAVVYSLLPQFLVSFFIGVLLRVRLQNGNTNIYRDIILSYFRPHDFLAWGKALLHSPMVLLSNYLFSNFVFIPIAALFVFAVAKITTKNKYSPVFWLVAANMLFFFCVLNFAPPYESRWQMRGEWIARVYQPIFVCMFIAIVAGIDAILKHKRYILSALCGLVVAAAFVGNFWVVFGTSQKSELSEILYRKFYETTPVGSITAQTEKYGVHLWKLCNQ